MKVLKTYLLLILSLCSANVFAQVSTNNPCNIGSQPGSEWPVDGVCYTFNKPTVYTALFNPGGCGSTANDDGWAWFVGTGGNMTINYTPPAGFNPIMHVFEAYSACAVFQVGCSNNGVGVAEVVNLTPSILGQIYFVRVQLSGSDAAMNGGCLSVSSVTPPTVPTYTHPTAGIGFEFVGSCLEATCTGTYTDDGGISGNYSNDVTSIYRVFCPNTAGNCVTMTFDYLDIENAAGCAFDYLTVGNGPTQNSALFTTAPALASGRICGLPAIPFSYTSTHTSGCLTLRFTSDGIVNAPGWAASISCTPCAGGPTGTTNSDCAFSTGICGNTGTPANSSGPGIVAEGCSGSNCPAGGENHTNWYAFQINTSGTLAFNIVPTVGTDDYDFAIYGPNVGCGSLGAPVRCSDAGTAGATGLAAGNFDFSENVTGNGFVAPMNVVSGEIYYLVVDEWTPTGAGYNLNFTGTATFDCTVLPIDLYDFSATYTRNENVVDLTWMTKSEINSDYYILERSKDGVEYEKLMFIEAAKNSTIEKYYIAIDQNPPSGIVYYRLIMVDQDGERKVSKVVSVFVDERKDLVKIFPNPANTELEIQITCDTEKPMNLAIYDQLGRLLKSQQVQCVDGNNFTKMDVSDLAIGTYIIQIEMDNLVEKHLIQISR